MTNGSGAGCWATKSGAARPKVVLPQGLTRAQPAREPGRKPAGALERQPAASAPGEAAPGEAGGVETGLGLCVSGDQRAGPKLTIEPVED